MSAPRPSYAKLAFHNSANYAFLGATALATLAGWGKVGFFPLAVGAGLEVLWLLVGSELPFVKRRFERRLAEADALALADQQRAVLGTLDDDERRRYHALVRLQGEIEREVEANPSLDGGALKSELSRLGELPARFLETAALAARLARFVAQSDLNDLERQQRVQGEALARQSDPELRAIAQKNAAILEQRVERAKEVHKAIRLARGQLNLIDNTVRLIRDQIVTMRSPRELTGQLEELTSAIDGLARAERAADASMARLDEELAAR